MARRKRSYDGQATRDRILDAAGELFQRHGYHATSMQELLVAAGVPGGSMYHFFPTKKGLALAVITDRVMAAVQRTWVAPVERARSAPAAILGVFEAVAAEVEARGSAIGCPVTNLAIELAGVDADLRDALAAAYAAWEDAIRARLQRSATPRVRRNAASLATLVVASFSGAMSLAKTTRSAEPLRRCARQLAPLLAGA